MRLVIDSIGQHTASTVAVLSSSPSTDATKVTTDLLSVADLIMARLLVVQARAILAVLIGDVLVVRWVDPDQVKAITWVVRSVVITERLDNVYE